MAKTRALLEEAAELRRSRPAGWFDRLDQEIKVQVADLAEALQFGNLECTKNQLAKWLVDRLKLGVNAQAVIKTLETDYVELKARASA